MKNLGIFIGDNGDGAFFHDILDHLSSRYAVSIFTPKTYKTPLLAGRLNRWAYRQSIRSILRRSDVGFFEWASEIVEAASHMPKYCPTVVRLHSYELFAWAHRIDWTKIDRIVLVSEAMRKKFQELYPNEAPKAEVVSNGVRLDVFYPGPWTGTVRIGLLCAFRPGKRIYEAILAFHKLRRCGVAASLHLAGGVERGTEAERYYVACRRLIEQLGLEDSVTCYGHITETAEWLRGIDVFVSNSYWEGQQVALLEALASGCYCLAHTWMGAEEVLPAEQLYTSDDELIAKIAQYADLPADGQRERRRRLREIAAERFDVAQQKSRIQDIINGVLKS